MNRTAVLIGLALASPAWADTTSVPDPTLIIDGTSASQKTMTETLREWWKRKKEHEAEERARYRAGSRSL